MPEYATENNKQTFYNALKKKYRDTDHERLKYSRQFLLALVAQAQDEKVEPKDYINLFYRILTRLADLSLIEGLERASLLLARLLKKIVSKIIKVHKVDQSDA